MPCTDVRSHGVLQFIECALVLILAILYNVVCFENSSRSHYTLLVFSYISVVPLFLTKIWAIYIPSKNERVNLKLVTSICSAVCFAASFAALIVCTNCGCPEGYRWIPGVMSLTFVLLFIANFILTVKHIKKALVENKTL